MGRRKRGKRIMSKPVEDMDLSVKRRKKFVPVKRPLNHTNELSEIVIFNSSLVPYAEISDLLESTSPVFVDDRKRPQQEPESNPSGKKVVIYKPGLFATFQIDHQSENETEPKLSEVESVKQSCIGEASASPSATVTSHDTNTCSSRPFTRWAKHHVFHKPADGKKQLDNATRGLHLLACAVDKANVINKPSYPIKKKGADPPSSQAGTDVAANKQSEKSEKEPENMELDEEEESVPHSFDNQYLNQGPVSSNKKDDHHKENNVVVHVETRPKDVYDESRALSPMYKSMKEELPECEMTTLKIQSNRKWHKSVIVSSEDISQTGTLLKPNPNCPISENDEKNHPGTIIKDAEKEYAIMENSGNQIQNEYKPHTESHLTDIRKWYRSNQSKELISCRIDKKATCRDESNFKVLSSDEDSIDSCHSSCSSSCPSREDSSSNSDDFENCSCKNIAEKCRSDMECIAEDKKYGETTRRKECLDCVAKNKHYLSSNEKGMNNASRFNDTLVEDNSIRSENGNMHAVENAGKEEDGTSHTETEDVYAKSRKEHLSPTRNQITEQNSFYSVIVLGPGGEDKLSGENNQNVPKSSKEECTSQEVKDRLKSPQLIFLPSNGSSGRKEIKTETFLKEEIQSTNIVETRGKAGISGERLQERTPAATTNNRVKVIVLKPEAKCPDGKQQSEGKVPTFTSETAARDNGGVATYEKNQTSNVLKDADINDAKIQFKTKHKQLVDDPNKGKLQDDQGQLNKTIAEVRIMKQEATTISDKTEEGENMFSLGPLQKCKDAKREPYITRSFLSQKSIISASKQSEQQKSIDAELMLPFTLFGPMSTTEGMVKSSKMSGLLSGETQAISLVQNLRMDSKMSRNESNSISTESPSAGNISKPRMIHAAATKTGLSQQSSMMCTLLSPLKVRIQRSSSEESDGKQSTPQDKGEHENDKHGPQDYGSNESKHKRSHEVISSVENNDGTYSKKLAGNEYGSSVSEETTSSDVGTMEVLDDEVYNSSESECDPFVFVSPSKGCPPQNKDDVEEMVVDKWPSSEGREEQKEEISSSRSVDMDRSNMGAFL